MALGPRPGPSVVMATDDPGADRALTPPPQWPQLRELPGRCPSRGAGTTLLKGARAGSGDGVSRGLTADVWPPWPDDAARGACWPCSPVTPSDSPAGWGMPDCHGHRCRSPRATPLPLLPFLSLSLPPDRASLPTSLRSSSRTEGRSSVGVGGGGQSTGLGTDPSGLGLCHCFPSVCPWASHLTPLSPSFL